MGEDSRSSECVELVREGGVVGDPGALNIAFPPQPGRWQKDSERPPKRN